MKVLRNVLLGSVIFMIVFPIAIVGAAFALTVGMIYAVLDNKR